MQNTFTKYFPPLALSVWRFFLDIWQWWMRLMLVLTETHFDWCDSRVYKSKERTSQLDDFILGRSINETHQRKKKKSILLENVDQYATASSDLLKCTKDDETHTKSTCTLHVGQDNWGVCLFVYMFQLYKKKPCMLIEAMEQWARRANSSLIRYQTTETLATGSSERHQERLVKEPKNHLKGVTSDVTLTHRCHHRTHKQRGFYSTIWTGVVLHHARSGSHRTLHSTSNATGFNPTNHCSRPWLS